MAPYSEEILMNDEKYLGISSFEDSDIQREEESGSDSEEESEEDMKPPYERFDPQLLRSGFPPIRKTFNQSTIPNSFIRRIIQNRAKKTNAKFRQLKIKNKSLHNFIRGRIQSMF